MILYQILSLVDYKIRICVTYWYEAHIFRNYDLIDFVISWGVNFLLSFTFNLCFSNAFMNWCSVSIERSKFEFILFWSLNAATWFTARNMDQLSWLVQSLWYKLLTEARNFTVSVRSLYHILFSPRLIIIPFEYCKTVHRNTAMYTI